MIGLAGTLILVPIAIAGLAVGFVRFAVKLAAALVDAGAHRLTPSH